MAYDGSTGQGDLSFLRAEGREPGARRKKLAGYLKAANELRQTYFAPESGSIGSRDGNDDSGVEGPGAFPDAAIVRSGNEEMMLFPSYARKHVKRKAAPPPASGDLNEQEYWRREWDRHQDDKAIVDVDVRGWIYTPQRGPTNRKQRLALGVVRQMAGLPPPPAAKPSDLSYSSQLSSRESSPGFTSKQDEELIAREAENIARKGKQEQRYANYGAFSEKPVQDGDGDSVYHYASRKSSRDASPDRGRHRLSQISLASSAEGDSGTLTPPHQQHSGLDPAKMSSAQLAMANSNLVNRFKPFLANPLADSPISAFFYDEHSSRQHTVYTNAAGHFTCRAALDFVPTHVRVLAGERLSATEEITITSPKGVSMISDIDDTVKQSGINKTAREIFRNTFVRELGDLTIDGVREWYNTLSDMGVTMHYVSNSPWQLYPVLTTYFKMAHLPKGSFHLKQYTGMLSGIFEPVAERKKSSLYKIMRDFPDRKFIFVGDSGEADLEVYTDVAVDNPGRVLGIFIRDVTTSIKTGYFDPSNGAMGGSKSGWNPSHASTSDKFGVSKTLRQPNDLRDDDADLRAAIAASLADMEEETHRARKSINPDSPSPENLGTPRPDLPPRRSERSPSQPAASHEFEEDLIDFSDAPTPSQSFLSPHTKANGNEAFLSKRSPPPPPKPRNLRSPPPDPERRSFNPESSNKAPPPRPRKPSSAVKPSLEQTQTWTSQASKPYLPSTPSQHQPSPLSQVTQQSPETKQKPALPARRKDYGSLTKGGMASYNASSPLAHWQSDAVSGRTRPSTSSSGYESPRTLSTFSAKSTDELRPTSSSTVKAAPAPPPRQRNMNSNTPSTTNRKASSRVSGAGSDGSGGSLPGSPKEAGMSNKEFMWHQRWARAKSVLERQGVTLRSWRVGSDVAHVCVKLVEQAFREMEKENKRERG